MNLPALIDYFSQIQDCSEKASVPHAVAQIGNNEKTVKLILWLLDDEYFVLKAAIVLAKIGKEKLCRYN